MTRTIDLAVRFVPERGTTIADLLHQLMDRDQLNQRELAKELDVAPATVWRLLHGHGVPQEHTLVRIARLTHLPITEVRRMAGRSIGALDPYIPTEEANQLTSRERALVDELIRVLLESRAPRVTRGRPTP